MSAVVVDVDNETEMKLEGALLLYRGGQHVYASSHEIVEVRGKPQIGAGVPLARAAIAPLAQALSGAVTYSGFLPSHLLYAKPGALVWWSPPATRHVWFQTRKPAAEDQEEDAAGVKLLGNRSGATPHPGLVFAAVGKDWFVRAVPGTARPDPGSKLLVAPYFNVWDGGGICTGNVKLPDLTDPGVTGRYESAFFRSRFTHPNTAQLVDYPSGPYALWAHLLDGRFDTFPEEHMRPARQTLDAWVKQITKRTS